MLKQICLLMLTLLWLSPGFAGPIEDLEFNDAQQETRYKDLIAELRCPKCLNSNLAGSDAPIAADLRAEIHRQILAGKSDDEIIAFLVDRYGEFILYRPRLHLGTAALWFGPPLLLIAGFFFLRRMMSDKQQLTAEQGVLSTDEQQQLQALLNTNKKAGSDNG